MSIFQKKYLLP